MAQKKFSPKEVLFLKAHAGILSGPQMANRLGRSIESIRNKAKAMKVSLRQYGDHHYNTVITDEEVEWIRQLAEDGMRYREIAEKFETTEDYIYKIVNYCKRLGRSCP